jgi:hypothetical protein
MLEWLRDWLSGSAPVRLNLHPEARRQVRPDVPSPPAPAFVTWDLETDVDTQSQPSVEPEEPGAADSPWSSAAVELYRSLIRRRLASVTCVRCSLPLEDGIVRGLVDATSLDEHRLSDTGSIALLVSTERRVVICSHCGSANEV